MTERAALARIEKRLEALASTQAEMRSEIGRLGEQVARLSPGGPAPSVSGEELIRFLDGFRAAEALGEASVGVWLDACTTAEIRGGLRTVQCREGMHARLLEQRIKELGGSPQQEIPEPVYRQVMERSGSADVSDAEKLLEFVKQFPDVEAGVRPIHDMADRLDGDPETRSLLRTIAQDERSTLEFLHDACARLNRS